MDGDLDLTARLHGAESSDRGGELLSSLLASRGRLPVALVLAVGVELAQALTPLHRGGMVHHGVRPDAIRCDEQAERAWLIDFESVRRAGTHRHAALGASTPAARLCYASPEHSGRTERAPDHRSDLYALGVVLFEMLTGAPPFYCDDALKLIHAHIARTPMAPIDLVETTPQPLSDIVVKLLAKAPEERYQSANGLIDDLQTCRRQWAAHGSVAAFALGRRDLGEQLTFLPRLYGREHELGVLRAAFERACRERAERPSMLLVAGYPGVGKTALIQELCRSIARQRGYFVAGKFDLVVRGLPFGGLIKAFRDLVQQLLTESQARVDAWRDALLGALGPNGGVLAEVIPEIEFIIGPQLPPVPLGPAEALNRFQRVIQNFVAAVARPEHPLLIFLDDLQWADAATLGLFEPLLKSPDIAGLLLIGAYRDSELDVAHHLARTLGSLESAGVTLQRIALGPLRLADLSQLVSDTLHSQTDEVLPLARLVLEKTGGNPFFVTQFLRSLERDGHFRFDEAAGRWTYRIEDIAAAPLADDVVDLMTRNIQRLSERSQRALTLAACIGSRFDRRTLAIISEQSQPSVADDLEQAAAEGLIVPALRHDGDAADSTADAAEAADPQDRPPVYSFLHDRVQQAAYALIPEERRSMLHLTIGRLLYSQATPSELERTLFDTVHHLNRGRSLITDAVERHDLARLNLRAGHKAKSSTAYDAALEFFQAGLALLDGGHWQSDYALGYALQLELAECQYLCGHFGAAEQQFDALLQRAATPIDRARVYRLRSLQFENMSRYADALGSARAGLALLDVALPQSTDAKQAALEREIDAIARLLGGRDVAALIELPVMTDPQILIVMTILTDIWSTTFILGDPTLARLISATMVRLSLEYGNVEESAYGYVTHAITVGPVRGDYRQAYEFGALALAVNHRFDDSRRRAKIYQQFHAHVNFWRQPLASCIPYAREACRSGLDSGDFLYAAYAAATELWSAIAATEDLDQFVREYEPSVAVVEKLKNQPFADSVRIILNWARALRGQTGQALSLSSSDGAAAIDEREYLRTYRDNPFFSTVHAVAKLHLSCLLGSAEQAVQAARAAAAVVPHTLGTIWPVIYEFWSAMALAAGAAQATPDERAAAMAQIIQAHGTLEVLADNCPDNFRCPALLLGAEIERLQGRDRSAIELCERAVEYADRPGLLQQRALANELAARLRLGRGERAIAALYMTEARACYARWGAAAKVEQLERTHPDLLRDDTAPARDQALVDDAAPASAPSDHDSSDLDLGSVMKAAQAIAGEIEQERLMARLMRIAIENAGAERGCLVLEQDGAMVVYRSDESDGSVALADTHSLPLGLVNYVRRTAQSVVLADAALDDRYGSDAYIVRHKPRSVMCVAVHKQARVVGVLYLENTMLAGVFTSQRIRLMQLLAAEAATALESAQLIAGLKREIRERSQAQEKLSAALQQVEHLKEDLEAENVYLRSDLITNVSHDLRTPLVSLRGYLEMLARKRGSLSAATQRSYLEIALRQSEHLATLIDELFELAKLDFKGLQLDLESFQLVELATDVLQKFQLAADGHRVTLRLEAAPDVPPVVADLGLIERVLDNLIGNALQHTPNGGTVSVAVRAEAQGVIASVSDNGAGIAPADLPHIFDRFYRAEKSRNRKSGGAGLGLAIARRIVELHGSAIEVDSALGKGSRFAFSLRAQITA